MLSWSFGEDNDPGLFLLYSDSHGSVGLSSFPVSCMMSFQTFLFVYFPVLWWEGFISVRCLCIVGMARYHFFSTDPIQQILSICRYRYRSDTAVFFYISVEFLYLSVCWPAHHSFVFYTQSTKYRQLYCKEKQQINGYVIIIYDKNSFIN